jgi:hypothetical protein
MAITHAKVSAKADGGDATLVRPSDWNASHSGINDHDHSAATTQGGAVAFNTPTIVLGSAAAAGAATKPIRSDATIAAFDATIPSDTGSAGATGSAAFASRRDHVHKAPGSLANITSGVAIANTETLVAAFVCPSANYLQAGTTFRITAGGTQTSGITGGTAVFRIRIGTTTLTGTIPTTVSPVNANSQTNVGFWFEALVTVRTAGAGGTVIGQCSASSQIGFVAPINMVGAVTATVAVDTTAASQRVELTYISGNAGTTATFQVATIDLVKA